MKNNNKNIAKINESTRKEEVAYKENAARNDYKVWSLAAFMQTRAF